MIVMTTESVLPLRNGLLQGPAPHGPNELPIRDRTSKALYAHAKI